LENKIKFLKNIEAKKKYRYVNIWIFFGAYKIYIFIIFLACMAHNCIYSCITWYFNFNILNTIILILVSFVWNQINQSTPRLVSVSCKQRDQQKRGLRWRREITNSSCYDFKKLSTFHIISPSCVSFVCKYVLVTKKFLWFNN
jgi:hypothetical protein